LTNICPLFYVETLADLSKSVRAGRTPEQEVGIIADRFPEMSGYPNAHHADLCISNLLGNPVPMTGQIPGAGGRQVKTDRGIGSVFEPSAEAKAFSRWQQHDFLEIEREFAREWRSALAALDLEAVTTRLQALGIDVSSCSTFLEAKKVAKRIAMSRDEPHVTMQLALLYLDVSPNIQTTVMERWKSANSAPLVEYAPYAAYGLMVELFIHICLAANLISGKRPSSRLDLSYLYYLPFCMMFVSSDNLHRSCAPLFMRCDQEFVWGPQLKSNLAEINDFFLTLPDSTKQQGILSFASEPPAIGDCMVVQLWDRLIPLWRRKPAATGDSTPARLVSVEEIKAMAEAPAMLPQEMENGSLESRAVVIKRRIKRQKGSWYQVAKGPETEVDH
ncbi:MAG: hypothetical protein ACE5JL_00285, partial [Dehalococcoidia bacterium]